MICNFGRAAPRSAFPVEPVEPVELGEIRRGHVAPVEPVSAGQVLPGSKSSCVVPPAPPTGPTKINKTACSTTGSTGPRRSATVLSRD